MLVSGRSKGAQVQDGGLRRGSWHIALKGEYVVGIIDSFTRRREMRAENILDGCNTNQLVMYAPNSNGL